MIRLQFIDFKQNGGMIFCFLSAHFPIQIWCFTLENSILSVLVRTEKEKRVKTKMNIGVDFYSSSSKQLVICAFDPIRHPHTNSMKFPHEKCHKYGWYSTRWKPSIYTILFSDNYLVRVRKGFDSFIHITAVSSTNQVTNTVNNHILHTLMRAHSICRCLWYCLTIVLGL